MSTSSVWYIFSPVFVDCYLFMYLFVCRPTQLGVRDPRMITQFILYEIRLKHILRIHFQKMQHTNLPKYVAVIVKAHHWQQRFWEYHSDSAAMTLHYISVVKWKLNSKQTAQCPNLTQQCRPTALLFAEHQQRYRKVDYSSLATFANDWLEPNSIHTRNKW